MTVAAVPLRPPAILARPAAEPTATTTIARVAEAALARAEAAGVRLWMAPDGRVTMTAETPPPAEVVTELRQLREEVAAILADRQGPKRDSHGTPADAWAAVVSSLEDASTAPDGPGSFLRSVARSVTVALAEGTAREPDPEGCLALVRPDGRQMFVAPRIVATLTGAGMLPPLPQESAADLQRPPSWSTPKDAPPPGAWCSCCGRFDRNRGRWWREAEALSGWCCWTCHPPAGRPEAAVMVART